MSSRYIMKWSLAAGLLLALAACGGGGGGSGGGSAGNNTIESGQASADSFFDQVFALVSAPTETGDPVAVEGFAISTPENAVPKSF